MELKLVAVSTTGWDVRVGVKLDNGMLDQY